MGAIALLLAGLVGGTAFATTYIPGFSEEVVFTGMSGPVALAFLPDGRVVVAEQQGTVQIFDSTSDTTPDLLIDITNDTQFFIDRGLLGMVVDPSFPAEPYLYLLYTLNQDWGDPGSPVPRWPDDCPDPPGALGDGCAVDGRLSRFEIALGSNTTVGGEQVLIEGRWCQQFPRNSLGDIVFDPADRTLLISAGDGASYSFTDYGQAGGSPGSPTPANVCDDPPVGRGGTQSLTSAEGGALRSQDLRTSGDPVSYDGAILRIDPDTGAAAPGNPLEGGISGDDAVIAYGLRNPYRIAHRPGTRELWIADIGWRDFEEINVIGDTTDAVVENFGWPCYEGGAPQVDYDLLDLDLCENLYADTVDPADEPFFFYAHGATLDPDPNPLACGALAPSAVSSLAFYGGASYPTPYSGSLFFADYARECLYTMFLGTDGEPNPSTRKTFADGVEGPAQLVVGPDGNLWIPEYDTGNILRIVHTPGNLPPTAAFDVTPIAGLAPVAFSLDASASSDPDIGDTLSYRWDLDDDGNWDEATGATFAGNANADGVYPINLRVTDATGEFDLTSRVLVVGNEPPVATILSPAPSLRWAAGETIDLVGDATDPQDGALPASAYEWEVVLVSCPDNGACTESSYATFSGTTAPSFTAPDERWYARLEVTLTVTDSGIPASGEGLLTGSATLTLEPATAEISLVTEPPGLTLSFHGEDIVAPQTRTVIRGASTPVVAQTPQDVGAATYAFREWLDDAGAGASRTIVGPVADMTYIAAYDLIAGCAPSDATCDGVDDDCDGSFDEDYAPVATSCGVGACAQSSATTCSGGVVVDPCTPGSPIGADTTCDGVDDDCNGLTDDQYAPAPTSCGVGACSGNAGELVCDNGATVDTCDPLAGATTDDTCDGVDDDCDGSADEHFVDSPTSCGLGECAGNAGTLSCVAGVPTDSCDPFLGAAPDDACDGVDDDCDGMTDDDYVGAPTSCGEGACSSNSGELACVGAPPVIYGANNSARLTQLDIGAQLDTLIDNLDFGTGAIELDPDSGRIYYFENTPVADELGYWDPVSGLSTLVRLYDPAPGIFAKRLAIAPDGTMYMMSEGEELYTVDKANGDLTFLGTVTGMESGSLGTTGDFAFATDGTLWVAHYQSLYTIDLQTLQATLQFTDMLPGGASDLWTGLAYCDGFLYGSDVTAATGLSAMYRIDPADGSVEQLWVTADLFNDLSSCPADGRRTPVFVDTCDPLAGASPDTDCDGIDDDCDGSVDEDFVTEPTSCGLGECAGNTGMRTCEAGGVLTDSCDPLAGASASDDSCNGIDDDCDGQTDEGYIAPPTSCGVGACAANSGELACEVPPRVLYGGNSSAGLWTLDFGLNEDTLVATLDFPTQAIEQDPATGFVYYFENSELADEFSYWDPATGLSTLVRTYVPAQGIFAKRLAMAPDGTMVMIDNDEQVFTVDLGNGDLTLLGSAIGLETGPNGAPGDIAFSTDGTLYVVTYRSLYTLDLDTLQATLLYSNMLSGQGLNVWTGLAYCDGVLYATDVMETTGRSGVYTIDPGDGTVTGIWLADEVINDLTSCAANGRRPAALVDTCDPFAGAAPDDDCDGIDDDCNGLDDDAFVSSPTTCGIGECAGQSGTRTCDAGSIVDSCDPLFGAQPDDDCNGRDDDCDGQTDEHFVDGPTTCGVGECAGNAGAQSCTPDPPVIFGANGSAELTTVDLLAQTDTPAGTLDFGTQAIELDPQTGQIYYFESTPAADELSYWDPSTGTSTLVRLYAPGSNVFAKRLAVAPDGTMYMMSDSEELYTVDTSNGDLTLLGAVTGLETGQFGATGDFAFATDGTLYLVTYRSLYSVDLDTLQATLLYADLINGTGVNIFTGLAYCDGYLWASDVLQSNGRSGIYRIDPTDGSIVPLWLAQGAFNDLSSCPASGRQETTFTDTCDPIAGATTDDNCNGLDDDCDGLVDEDYVPEATSCGVGECAGNTGTRTCEPGGVLVDSCDPIAGATTDDNCNGLDDDCDGTTDEHYVPEPTSCGVGECSGNTGTRTCDPGGVLVDSCDPLSGATTDDNCNGLDDDCDGSADEDYVPEPTSCGVGECSGNTGTRTCDPGGVLVDSCDPLAGSTTDDTCNGLDDDCDGTADEHYVPEPTSCGVGECSGNTGTRTCDPGGVLVDSCDPLAGATTDDTCNGLDDDCDGAADEHYVPEPTSCGVGECSGNTGTRTCDPGGVLVDSCDPFAGATTDDTCNGLDDDCDGAADEHYVPEPTSCGVGECSGNTGTRTCDPGGVLVDSCDPLAGATTDDTCNGLDDDCDGAADEHYVPEPTSCGVGECAGNTGTRTCDPGGVLVDSCDPLSGATTDDNCNGLDDDCDGSTDEDYVPEPTSCGVGECSGNTGTRTCDPGGVLVDSCDPLAGATTDDTCNGLDDDCDGTADEHYVPEPTSCGVGECSGNTGTRTCDPGGVLVDSCDPLAGATTDDTCNGLDDDCDGAADEHYVPEPTSCGVGECSGNTGTRTCDPGGVLVDSCDPLGGATTDDTCNGLDDDCDGTADEHYVPEPTSCGVGECAGNTGTRTCDPGGVLVDSCDPLAGATTDDTCNGLDDDCDGAADEHYVTEPTSCGVGECSGNTGTRTCDPGGVLVDSCDPVAGASTDDNCNGLDDDCDGSVDEDYVPEPTSCGVGECSGNTGTRTCDPGGVLVDSCDPFAGATTDDTCNGLDDDCDGTADEHYAPEPTSCGVGECSGNTGTRTCDPGGVLVDSCDPLAGATTDDTCNGLDDDCDGTADEHYVPEPTSCGVGECSGNTGTRTCDPGGVLVDSCDPLAGATTDDTCNGLDDDCDGTADEHYVPEPTSCGVGECAGNTGTRTCDPGGVLVDSCDPLAGAATDDSCNGLDDDCDGTADEHYVPEPTSCGVGECSGNTGTRTCDPGGVLVDSCDPLAGATTDDNCNGLDDDCDGLVDEDYVPEPTTCGVGECAGNTGTRTCDPGGVLVDSCDPVAGATTDDNCNGLDDDCDGSVDEDYVPQATSCGVGECAGNTGTLSCDPGGVLVDSCDPLAGATTDDTCNGLDDDCDGSVDEEYVPEPTSCGVGECSGNTGTRTCDPGGVLVDSCDPLAGATTDDTCNGLDDDCDGAADEHYVPEPTSCGVGECAGNTGTRTCDPGGVLVDSCDPLAGATTDDTCNGLDDDCDGTADEHYVPEPTSCGVGECSGNTGTRTCDPGGVLVDSCDPLAGAVADDSCNGLDDDCDGTADEHYVPEPTSCGVGECAGNTGARTCDPGGVLVDSCDPLAGATTDDTCNGLDDDCDGIADEHYAPEPTTCGVGECAGNTGTRTCDPGGVLVDSCDPLAGATTDDTCNGLDDDCDGMADEHYVPEPTSCGVGECSGNTGTRTCDPGGVLVDSCDPLAGATTDDTCNGLDDDCDGTADEHYVPEPTSCGVGECSGNTGTRTCDPGGVLVDSCDPLAGATTDDSCNGLDDDCDGTADEHAPTPDPLADTVVLGPISVGWSVTTGATEYDVLRGGLGSLLQTGDFAVATTDCLASAVVALDAPHGSDPAPGAGFWYLVRPRSCTASGGWDSAGTRQVAGRDAGIAASGAECP